MHFQCEPAEIYERWNSKMYVLFNLRSNFDKTLMFTPFIPGQN
jgi:hypothetical protein